MDGEALEKWKASAAAWIKDQGEHGDWSRRAILDPALEQVLPDVRDRTVLDVGCGEGRYSRILKSKGARVTGVDPVPEFIQHARRRDSESVYVEAAAESMPLPDQHFDLLLSYLSLVDIPDLRTASAEFSRVLKPDGELLIVNISNLASSSEGWVKDEHGRKLFRRVDRYMEHFALDLQWRGIQIRNYHRPLSYILGLFFEQGFGLNQFIEPLPHPEDRNYADEFRVPNFQILVLRRTN